MMAQSMARNFYAPKCYAHGSSKHGIYDLQRMAEGRLSSSRQNKIWCKNLRKKVRLTFFSVYSSRDSANNHANEGSKRSLLYNLRIFILSSFFFFQFSSLHKREHSCVSLCHFRFCFFHSIFRVCAMYILFIWQNGSMNHNNRVSREWRKTDAQKRYQLNLIVACYK